MQDPQRRLVCCRSAQRRHEPFLVRVGHRQPEDLVPVAACGQRVDQRLHDIGVVADEEPGGSVAGLRRRGAGGRLPADLVAVVRDGLGFRCWLCCAASLCQHIGGLSGCRPRRRAARRVPRSGRPRAAGRLRYARLSDAVGLGGRTCCLGTSTGDAGTDRWAGRACRAGSADSAPKSGRWPDDVGVGQGFGDLAVVGGVSAQRRDRPRRGGRVRPCPQGRGGEHRLRADLQQQLAAEVGQGAPRSWRIRPVGARGGANRRRRASRSLPSAAPVRLQTRIRCGEPKSNRFAYDSNSSRIGSSSAEWNAWLVSSQSHRTPSAVSPATACSRSAAGPDSTVLAPL